MAAIDNLNTNIVALTAAIDALPPPAANQDVAIQAAADAVAAQTARIVALEPPPAKPAQ